MFNPENSGDWIEGKRLIVQAANMGNMEAVLHCANTLCDTPAEKMKYLKIAADAGDADSQCDLSLAYKKTGNIDLFLKYSKACCSNGSGHELSKNVCARNLQKYYTDAGDYQNAMLWAQQGLIGSESSSEYEDEVDKAFGVKPKKAKKLIAILIVWVIAVVFIQISPFKSTDGLAVLVACICTVAMLVTGRKK